MSHLAIHTHIIKNINEGIITIGLDGKILDFNPAAESLLEMTRDEVLTQSFGALFLLDNRNDAFAQAVIDAIYDAHCVHNNVVHFHRKEDAVSLALSTSFLHDKAGEKHGVIAVFRDVTELEALREVEGHLNQELTENNQKLADSYLQAKEVNLQLETALSKVKVVRIITLFVLLLFLGISLYVWNFRDTALDYLNELDGPLTIVPSEGTTTNTVIIKPQPFISSIKLIGFIEPLQVVNVVSPLAGYVLERNFRYGQRVNEGDLLFQINTDAASVKARDARASYIKALEAMRKLDNWSTSLEITRAQRNQIKAKASLDLKKQRLTESKRLLDAGIISTSEYDSSKIDLTNAKMEYRSSQEDLAITQAKGGGDALAIAKLQLENARYLLQELETKLKRATVLAPVSGVVLLVTVDGKQLHLDVGSEVAGGAVAISIGDLQGISVTVEVDEVEIGRIHPYQSVLISGEAFPGIVLKGQVTRVSSQASQLKIRGSSSPTFSIQVQVSELSKEQQKRIRVGMSVDLDIQIYNNPNALMAPLQAVHSGPDGPYVWIMKSGAMHRTPVKAGLTTLDQVEIVSGLEPGTQLVLGPPLSAEQP